MQILYFDFISTKFLKSPIDKSALYRVMTWYRTGD